MTTTDTTTTPQRAGRRAWAGLAVLATVAALMSIDISVLYLALPQLSGDLGASASQQLWIMDIYSFMLAGFLVTMGTLGDRIGRRRLLLIGAAAFGLVSIAAAYSPDAGTLILFRALLGVAGATLMPSSMSLIRTMFTDPKQMGAAIGLWFSCFLGGMALGPLVGGLLLQHFWWGSAFLLGVPFMVLVLLAGPVLLPEYRDRAAGRIDLTSVALSLAAILPAVYGLKELARYGVQPLSLTAVAAGVVAGLVFARRQRRLAHPLLDLSLFANRAFSATLAVLLLGGVVMAGVTLMSTQYIQLVEGLSPLETGLWLLPPNIAMIVAMSAGPALVRRIRPVHVMAGGLLLGAAGFTLHALIAGPGGLTPAVAGLVLASVGIALPMSLGNGVIMQVAPQEKAGSVAAVSETSGEFGVAVGVAALGSLATAVYRGALPEDVPAAVHDSFAAAARQPSDVLEVARLAFTSGFNAVAVVGALTFVALAAVTLVVLRGHGAATEPAESADLPTGSIAEPVP